MADQNSTRDRARRVQQFISQARQGDGGMREWLARRAQVTQAPTNEAALAKARGDQQMALRAAMRTPGALQLAEASQPGASTGGPAPIAPAAPSVAPTAPAAPSMPYANFGGTITGAMMPRNLGGSLPVDFGGFDSLGNPIDTGGNFMQPPPGVDRGSWMTSMAAEQTRNANPAGFDADHQAQAQRRNAYGVARDAALGMMLPGSVGANGVDYGQAQSDPSAALRAFNASGYTEQRALADGWGTGVGTAGWTTPSPSQQLTPSGGNAATSPPVSSPAANPATAVPGAPVPPPVSTPAAPSPSPAAMPPAATSPAATVPVATPAANPSASLAAAIQNSTAPPAAPATRTAVPQNRTGAAPVAPPVSPPAAPAAQKPSDTDVRNALNAQPRTSAAPRIPGGSSRVGLG